MKSGRVYVDYDKDKFFSMNKFSDLVMGDNFAKEEGKLVRDKNEKNSSIKKKFGVKPLSVIDLRFMSHEAKKE